MSIGGFPSFIEDLKVRFEPIGYLIYAITTPLHKDVVNIYMYIYEVIVWIFFPRSSKERD